MKVFSGTLTLAAASMCIAGGADRASVEPEPIQRAMSRLHGHVEPPPVSFVVSQDAGNAAGRYAWVLQRQHPDLKGHWGWLRADAFESGARPEDEAPPLEAIERLFEGEQQWFRDLIEATKVEGADFELGDAPRQLEYLNDDPRRGLVTNLRVAVRLLQSDSHRLFKRGESEAAWDRIEAGVRLAKHMADQRGPLIYDLVSNAAFTAAMEAVQQALDAGRQPEAARAERLLALLETFDASDPTGMREACRLLRERQFQFARAKLAGDNVSDLRYDLQLTRAQEKLAEVMFAPLRRAVERLGAPAGVDKGDADESLDQKNPFSVSAIETVALCVDVLLEAAAMHPTNLERELKRCEAWSIQIDERWTMEAAEFRRWHLATFDDLPEDLTGLRSWSLVSIVRSIQEDWQEERSALVKAKESLRTVRQPPPAAP